MTREKNTIRLNLCVRAPPSRWSSSCLERDIYFIFYECEIRRHWHKERARDVALAPDCLQQLITISYLVHTERERETDLHTERRVTDVCALCITRSVSFSGWSVSCASITSVWYVYINAYSWHQFQVCAGVHRLLLFALCIGLEKERERERERARMDLTRIMIMWMCINPLCAFDALVRIFFSSLLYLVFYSRARNRRIIIITSSALRRRVRNNSIRWFSYLVLFYFFRPSWDHTDWRDHQRPWTMCHGKSE